ncbi:MAG: Asp-tRNA(Asn)/Glu-tRNA(Gln) amidotransferase subunit GatB [Patescibacteria group bacterium]
MENDLIPKIGLEIHLELNTETKLFCSCKNDPYETEPNKNICEICTGQPGVLPVLNKKAVVYAISLAKALNMAINYQSRFARKHYFYPDLPKNYQISQYDQPLGENGFLELIREDLRKIIRIRRIHLEEDTGRNIHFGNYSFVDFNRAGVPLIEIVTEPDIRSSYEAEVFCEELVLLIRYLGISEADAEKGQIRFEANISLAPKEELGTKVEIKNINSIRSLVEAIDYEIERQKKLILNGERIIRETRGFDDVKKSTFSQRWKEEEADYRYFPEPDLPPLIINEEIEKEIILIETPSQIKKRFEKEYGLEIKVINTLVKDKFLVHFFEESFSELYELTKNFEETKKLVVNYLVNDLIGLQEKLRIKIDENKLTPHQFAHLLFSLYKGKISSKIVKEALETALTKGLDLEKFLSEKEMISDAEILNKIIEKIINENPEAVNDYLKGTEEAFEYLIGKIMKETKGRADPNLTRFLLQDKLKNASR